MADFLPAFEYVMQYEDSRHSWAVVTDNNSGQVVAGINSKAFPEEVAAIVAVAQDQRESLIQTFYRNKLWTPMMLGALDSQDLASRVMDMETNAGEGAAGPELQNAINTLTSNAVKVDGKVGPLTIAAANNQNQAALLNAFRAQRVAYYNEVAAKNPDDAQYLKVWLARAAA
jgi:lysozyme family protein